MIRMPLKVINKKMRKLEKEYSKLSEEAVLARNRIEKKIEKLEKHKRMNMKGEEKC